MRRLLLVAAALTFALPATADTVKLTTLEWPPYTGADLSGMGASTEVVKAAFAAMDQELAVEVLPWKRAVKTGLEDPAYGGYYPEYFDATMAEETCHYSDPIGTGPLGLVENRTAPITWQSLDDLKGVTIGTVAGYLNTPEFDQRAKDGQLTVAPSPADIDNLRKVAAKRLDAAVIDRNVLAYLLATENSIPEPAVLQFDEKVLADKELFICFQPNDHGRALAEIFNQGLAKVDVPAVMAAYFAEHLK